MSQNVTTRQGGADEVSSSLIRSDRVEGTKVHDLDGKHIGNVKRLTIDKASGRVAYVVVSFGGFLGMGADDYAVPWESLTYDPVHHGYQTGITKEQLEGAPSFYRASAGGVGSGRRPTSDTLDARPDSDYDYDWSDRGGERDLHDYYAVAYYWDE